jgi:hypothetical protein
MKPQLHMGWLFPLAEGTQAEQEAYTALAGLAHTWAKRNTAERVTDAMKPACMALCHQLRHPCALCKVAGCLRKGS